MEEKPKVNVTELFTDTRKFHIPTYQRSYKWGVKKSDLGSDTRILIEDLWEAFNNHREEYFIQGITGFENSCGEFVLIDGQQRVTTFFLFIVAASKYDPSLLVLLRGNENGCIINYAVRYSSQKILDKIAHGHCRDIDWDKTQEGSIFRRSLQCIERALERIEDSNKRISFIEYILTHVKMFRIKINAENAPRTFELMNGAKAYMLADELVKSDFLSKASQSEEIKSDATTIDGMLERLRQEIGNNWADNEIRSHMAREWDRWVYWWNVPKHRKFFRVPDDAPLGWLLPIYTNIYLSPEESFVYSNDKDKTGSVLRSFQNAFIKDKQKAKLNFEKLRKLQKGIEDLYSESTTYNYLGFILSITGRKEAQNIVQWFILNRNDIEAQKKYALMIMAGMDSTAISKDGIDSNSIKKRYDEKKLEFRAALLDSNAYNSDPNALFKWLFFRNVQEYISRASRFEFIYFDKKKDELVRAYDSHSIEHIWPKSRVIFTQDGQDVVLPENGKSDDATPIPIQPEMYEGKIRRQEDLWVEYHVTEHCIGNLVYLHRNDNSLFNDKLPEDKKKILFNLADPHTIYTRPYLHTISAFGIDEWAKDRIGQIISDRKKKETEDFDKLYEIQKGQDEE